MPYKSKRVLIYNPQSTIKEYLFVCVCVHNSIYTIIGTKLTCHKIRKEMNKRKINNSIYLLRSMIIFYIIIDFFFSLFFCACLSLFEGVIIEI